MTFDFEARGFSAVILAGGTAARMDGVDKGGLEVDGRTLLERAIESLIDADEVVVVARESVPTTRPVTTVYEDPPLGGPVAGLLTGLDALLRPPRLLGVMAVDMPHVTAHTFRRLREAITGDLHGAALVDADGRRQLCLVLDVEALQRHRPDHEGQHGLALHRLLAPLDLAAVAAYADEAHDIDSWDDLTQFREAVARPFDEE